ncbi:MAG: Thymidylate kinase [Myxococcaceae bacterium]|nr:Thymidylate kinase [Myxococcaceae bacterium]
MIEGHFIAIEGIDGAGTTTQAARLAAALRKKGLPVRTTHEPTDGPVGSLIRQVLNGRVVVGGPAGSTSLGWSTLALLFAADRLDHLQAEVIPNLMDGVTVITDRYDASSIAYQGVVSGDEAVSAWIRTINGRARRPDLTLVLDVSAETATERRRLRGNVPDLYEEDELQRRLARFYETIERYLPGDRVLHLDGNADADAVHAQVLAAVEALRAEG